MTYDLSATNESQSEHAVHENELTPRKGRDRIFFFFLLVTDKAPLNLKCVVAEVDLKVQHGKQQRPTNGTCIV